MDKKPHFELISNPEGKTSQSESKQTSTDHDHANSVSGLIEAFESKVKDIVALETNTAEKSGTSSLTKARVSSLEGLRVRVGIDTDLLGEKIAARLDLENAEETASSAGKVFRFEKK